MDGGSKIQINSPRVGEESKRTLYDLAFTEPSRNEPISLKYHKQCKQRVPRCHWQDFPTNSCCHFFKESLARLSQWFALVFDWDKRSIPNETMKRESFFFCAPHKHWLLCCRSRRLWETLPPRWTRQTRQKVLEERPNVEYTPFIVITSLICNYANACHGQWSGETFTGPHSKTGLE